MKPFVLIFPDGKFQSVFAQCDRPCRCGQQAKGKREEYCECERANLCAFHESLPPIVFLFMKMTMHVTARNVKPKNIFPVHFSLFVLYFPYD